MEKNVETNPGILHPIELMKFIGSKILNGVCDFVSSQEAEITEQHRAVRHNATDGLLNK